MSAFPADMEKQRADQMALNCRWLIEQMDVVHRNLCPGEKGSWQDRVRQVVAASSRKASTLKRMWIDQPSTHQTHHKLHARNVLAYQEYPGTWRVYFLEGDISMQMSAEALSKGWLK